MAGGGGLMSVHVVENGEDARRITDYFNAFHDGFIRRLVLLSADYFESKDAHVTTGHLDLEIAFAHNNYLEGRAPFDRVVEARFESVRDLRVAFTGHQADWPITAFEMTEQPGGGGQRLRATMIQPRLIDNTRWEREEALSFTFARAELREPEE